MPDDRGGKSIRIIAVKGALHQFYMSKESRGIQPSLLKLLHNVLFGSGGVVKSGKTTLVTSQGLSRLGLGDYKEAMRYKLGE